MAMLEAIEASNRVNTILLATDLSSRGDRALDRTMQLARHWGAQVHVVHAVDAVPPAIPAGVDVESYLQSWPDPKPEALRQLARLVDDLPVKLHVESGAAAQAILAVSEREGCDLIVLGERRDRLVGPLESTADEVLRKAGTSVLMVRTKSIKPYRQLVVGTDYTDEALQALSRAIALFPDADVTLIHAYAKPYAGLRGHEPLDPDWVTQELAKLQSHVDKADIAVERRRAIHLQAEAGPPASVLRQHLLKSSADLTVIGAHARGMLYDTIVGSSRLIVDALPGDILVVRAVRREA